MNFKFEAMGDDAIKAFIKKIENSGMDLDLFDDALNAAWEELDSRKKTN